MGQWWLGGHCVLLPSSFTWVIPWTTCYFPHRNHKLIMNAMPTETSRMWEEKTEGKGKGKGLDVSVNLKLGINWLRGSENNIQGWSRMPGVGRRWAVFPSGSILQPLGSVECLKCSCVTHLHPQKSPRGNPVTLLQRTDSRSLAPSHPVATEWRTLAASVSSLCIYHNKLRSLVPAHFWEDKLQGIGRNSACCLSQGMDVFCTLRLSLGLVSEVQEPPRSRNSKHSSRTGGNTVPGHSVWAASDCLLRMASVEGVRASLLLCYSAIAWVTFLNRMLPSKENTHPLPGEGSEAGVRHRI